jgi:hypothetical protein
VLFLPVLWLLLLQCKHARNGKLRQPFVVIDSGSIEDFKKLFPVVVVATMTYQVTSRLYVPVFSISLSFAAAVV